MGVASLPRGQELGVFGAVVCKYRLVSATLSLYHQCQKIKEAVSLKVKGLMHSCLLIMSLKYIMENCQYTRGLVLLCRGQRCT